MQDLDQRNEMSYLVQGWNGSAVQSCHGNSPDLTLVLVFLQLQYRNDAVSKSQNRYCWCSCHRLVRPEQFL